MTEYTVVSQIAIGEADPNVEGAINHRHYTQGQVVELDDETAKAYLADGAVRRIESGSGDSDLSEEEQAHAAAASQTPAERSAEDKSGTAEESDSKSSKKG